MITISDQVFWGIIIALVIGYGYFGLKRRF